MKIIVDAFGGDNAPLCNIEGSILAKNEYGVDITLCGDEKKIIQCANDNNLSLDGIKIKQADEIFSMHDEPNTLVKSKKNTSLAVAFKSVADGEYDAIVSAGSSGAVLMGATFIVKRIKGIKRPAFAAVLPSPEKPYMILDSGANIGCRAEMLYQFAILGNAYMKKMFNLDAPKVGLLNIGAEETKGGDMLVEVYQMLKNSNMNFIGNVEARDLPNGVCDVVVCDGFAGNIALKLTEGVSLTLLGMVKQIFVKNVISKLGALLVMSGVKALKKKMDYSEYGGAPVLGVEKAVIKAHGSSNAKAIKSAIRQAKTYVELGVIDDIKETLKTK